jgi:HicB-like protein involved in pilus formation
MPAGLHEELARAADSSGISLNQFITNVLAGSVGWGRPASPGGGSSKRRPQTLTILLALNLLLVAAAAAAAIAFLVAAWLN